MAAIISHVAQEPTNPFLVRWTQRWADDLDSIPLRYGSQRLGAGNSEFRGRAVVPCGYTEFESEVLEPARRRENQHPSRLDINGEAMGDPHRGEHEGP